MTDPAKKAAALSFLNAHAAGVLATLSKDGAPRARTVYYAAGEDFAIYFLTLSKTRKIGDIEHNPRAAFVVSSEEMPQTIQIEGTVEDLTETATITPAIERLSQIMQKHGVLSAPLSHFSSGDKIVFYKLTPTWVRWGDFTDGIGDEAIYSEFPV